MDLPAGTKPLAQEPFGVTFPTKSTANNNLAPIHWVPTANLTLVIKAKNMPGISKCPLWGRTLPPGEWLI